MTSVDLVAAWRRGQQGWPARFVLVQFPNPPLILALTAFVVARLTAGSTASYADAVGHLSLTVFAYLELTQGASWPRRLLGGAVLVQLVLTLGHAPP